MNSHSGTTLGDQISESTYYALEKMKEQMETPGSSLSKIDEVENIDIENELSEEDVMDLLLGRDSYTLNDLLKINYDKIPFLVEGLIPKNNLSMLVGSSDMGKSTLYTQLVKDLISGEEKFLWREINPKYRRALVISTEDDEIVFSIRIKRQLMGIAPSEEVGNRLTLWPSGRNLIDRLNTFLSANKVDLIVIDAFMDVFHGDMNSGNDTRAYLDQLSELAKKHRTAILIVHHLRKTDKDAVPDKEKVLGSVGIEGKVRSVIFLSRIKNDPDGRGLHIVKGNYIEDGLKTRSDVLLFEKDSLTFTKIDDTERRWVSGVEESKPGVKRDPELVARALALKDEGKTLEEIGKEIGRNKSSVSRMLKRKPIKFMVDKSIVVP